MTHPYGQNIVACIWDFDKTLIPGYMQTPLFEYYGVNENMFWEEGPEPQNTFRPDLTGVFR